MAVAAGFAMRMLGLFWGTLLGTVLIALYLAVVGGIVTVLFMSPFLIGAMIVGLIIGTVLVVSAPRPVIVSEVRYMQGQPPPAGPWAAPSGPRPLPRPNFPAAAGGIDPHQPVEIAPGLWRRADVCSLDDLAAATQLLRARRREGPHRPFGSG
jgi:hypothetical protein